MFAYIRTFIKVVETGSFSKAAAVLNVAPSSVARNIDALEQELNCTLFLRSTRFLKLTDKGSVFLQGAIKLLNDADHLQASLNEKLTEPAGALRISTFESFGRLHLCPITSGFLATYPKVSVELELDNKMRDLFSDDIDIAIRIGAPADSQLKSRTLVSNDAVICATPEYVSKFGKPIAPEDLALHNCLLLNQNRQRTYWYFQKGRQQRKVQVEGNLKSKGGTPLLNACLNNLGISLLPYWMVAEYVKTSALVTCLTDWQCSPIQRNKSSVYALYKQSNYPNPLIRLYIDYLLGNLPEPRPH
ncbi:LysR family transcriptional regulator [Alteromonas sp. MMG017]|uniref:LysR family transcriptional regulator n=1 Tax=Alteromonas sp. MMG017 TaxID=2822692 RepID=UPI001B39D091|nr:LysR family transcriptional regulator [Alteromonas sp. MMG017]MBQ4827991.1 LysR family transcriptional regulator [Alteromonas sp. MMG017]